MLTFSTLNWCNHRRISSVCAQPAIFLMDLTNHTKRLKLRSYIKINLRQKYEQPVKDQGEDVHGAHLRPTPLKTNAFEARYPPARLLWLVHPTNFAPVGDRARTTPRGCGRVRHSSGRVLARERHPFRHTAADLRFYQNWFWRLLLLRTS